MKKKLSKKQVDKVNGGAGFQEDPSSRDIKEVARAITKDKGNGGIKPKTGIA